MGAELDESAFHPAVANWFRATHGRPTEPQRRGWPHIQAGRHTLIAAPTGSGKTLAAFLTAIDTLVRQGVEGSLRDEVSVLYVSPLKALSNDIEKNLAEPLAGIAAELDALGLPSVPIRTLVRTGDTPAKQRALLSRHPPHIVVTTPESLYILLTSESGRKALSSVRSVIVDEIHAVLADKRGAHLAVSLERLDALATGHVTRIGLSATQKPIERVANFLVGQRREAAIVDCGHQRAMRLSIEMPPSPLEAVMSAEVWSEVYDRIASLVTENRTTLVFVGNRRLAERLCKHLSLRLGDEQVAAHHGSLSKETRLDAETRLKTGSLRALVATASLELGIDIGSVDLVCQLGSTRGIGRLLQRVGRAGHHLAGVPEGRLFPLSRNDLLECAALVDCVRRGELDAITPPQAPIDIAAQHIVAAVSAQNWSEEDLFLLLRRSYPYRDLTRERFESVLSMLDTGFDTRRGRRSALVRRDLVTGEVQARKAARLVALTSGGAIPDNSDYRVVLEPDNTHVGSIGEDFAIEAMGGDIFQLGNASWKILKVEAGVVRVADAKGQPPTIPFWLGEAPARSDELSSGVSRLKQEIAARLEQAEGATGGDCSTVIRWLVDERGLCTAAAQQLVDYLAAAHRALGCLPTQQRVIVERFFDEAQNTHVVLHSSFGARINRAWGLALRKRFCRTFNFELQAAATEDAIILSLGPTHSFELEGIGQFLRSATALQVLVQALLDAPMFEIRWRYNATRSLATPRFSSGKKVPAHLIRIRANDLLATAFPDQQACLENIAGEREVPNHPLVQQTIFDCLTEAMDGDGFISVLSAIESGDVTLSYRDVTEPSPLSHEILNANPYAFLDPAPLEERRTQAVITRRFFNPDTARDLGSLDADAIERVRREAWPESETADQLSDALSLTGFMTQAEVGSHAAPLLATLASQGRATLVTLSADRGLWVGADRLAQLLAVCPGATPQPRLTLPAALEATVDEETAWVELMRARLESLGPVSEAELARPLGDPTDKRVLGRVASSVRALEGEGCAMSGHFTPGSHETEWCERGLLARIHRYTLERLRREIEPVTSAAFMRFLFSWQRVGRQHRQLGPHSLESALGRLEGFEAAAGAWERGLLAVRVEDYSPRWLDELCLSGQIRWARTRAPATARSARSLATTPLTLGPRSGRGWPVAFGGRADEELSPVARRVAEALRGAGPSFYHDLREVVPTRSELDLALSELVAAGRATSDSFAGMRGLLPVTHRRPRPGRRARPTAPGGIESAGRWSLIEASPSPPTEASAEGIAAWAQALLRRYGVVFWALLERESAPPWRDLLREYRRLEARGEVRGGRFVQRHAGEQFALPDAVPLLRRHRDAPPEADEVCLSACDPLNLLGSLLPGDRVTAAPTNLIFYRDGLPIAVLEGRQVRFIEAQCETEQHRIAAALRRGPGPIEESTSSRAAATRQALASTADYSSISA